MHVEWPIPTTPKLQQRIRGEGHQRDVLVPPEHALGHPGRSPGVDAVEIVGAARGKSRMEGADSIADS